MTRLYTPYKYGSLVWSESEGKLRLTEAFDNEHVVFQLDALSDWIGELTKEYNIRLQASRDDYDRRAKGAELENKR